jgi:membrane associated rhomboid family serine protease
MFGRPRTGSTLCPSCGMLVGVNDAQCLNCGRRRPGLFGLTALLRTSGLEDAFVPIVMWGCGAMYLASLAVDQSWMQGGGLMSLLAPGNVGLFVLGESGAVPVFGYGRWWTILSASWLHGGLLHILFNMTSVRNLGPAVSHFYGGARTFIIYLVAGATGFLASSVAAAYLSFLPSFLHGGEFTVGASAGIFGLIGAVLHYGRRGGSAHLRELATRWIVMGLAFGFFVPRIDNWAHIGGLAGGYLMSFWLDPLRPERGKHTLIAVIALAVSLAAIVYSVPTGKAIVDRQRQEEEQERHQPPDQQEDSR